MCRFVECRMYIFEYFVDVVSAEHVYAGRGKVI